MSSQLIFTEGTNEANEEETREELLKAQEELTNTKKQMERA